MKPRRSKRVRRAKVNRATLAKRIAAEPSHGRRMGLATFGDHITPTMELISRWQVLSEVRKTNQTTGANTLGWSKREIGEAWQEALDRTGHLFAGKIMDMDASFFRAFADDIEKVGELRRRTDLPLDRVRAFLLASKYSGEEIERAAAKKVNLPEDRVTAWDMEKNAPGPPITFSAIALATGVEVRQVRRVARQLGIKPRTGSGT